MMASFVSYEVQTFRNGAWKIESICDDRAIAIFEAKRILHRPHNLAVRVLEETRRPGENDGFVKTIYRVSKAEDSARPLRPGEVAARRAAEKRAEARARRAGDADELEFEPAWGAAARESAAGPVGIVLLLATLVLAGIGSILALRHYFGAL